MKTLTLAVVAFLGVTLMGGIAFADIKCNWDGGVVTGYDDNVTYAHDDRISDMITKTSLGGGLTQQGPNDTFDLNTLLTENIYTEHSQYDNLAESLNSDYKVDLGPYEHLNATEVYTHSVDPSLANGFGRINGVYGTYYNNLDLESKTDITEQWSTTVKYIQTNYLYSLSSLSNTTLYNPELSTEYDFSSQSQATLNYDYRLRSFDPGKSAEANTPSAGWRQYLTPQWYVDLLAGADFINGFGEDRVEPRYAAGLTHDLDQNTQLTLKYDKQFETDQYTQNITNDWHLTLNGFHEFTARISGDIALFTGQGKYLISEITEKYIGTSISAKYQMNEHWDLVATYTFEDGASNSANRSNTQDTVYMGVEFKY